MKLSFVSKSVVFHVGERKQHLRKNNNYEGFGLCVSECPMDWVRICKLGGLPTYKVQKKSGLFADFHSVDKDLLGRWAVDNGYADEVDVYQVYFVNGETDEECFISTENFQDATLEAESCETEVVIASMFVPSAVMNEHFGFEVERSSALEYALQIYTENKFPDIDGVWFDNDNDGYFSAPSGVIFERKLSEWDFKKMNA